MPITPFHFGPGLLVRAALPRRFSFLAFVASQIAVDVEVLWRFLAGVRPLHGPLHTIVLATPVGLVVGAIAAWAASRLFPRTFSAYPLRHESTVAAGMLGGAIGGASHPLLDGLMHADVTPFWPFVAGNPLLGLVPLRAIYLGCVIAGVIALGMLMGSRRSARALEGARQRRAP